MSWPSATFPIDNTFDWSAVTFQNYFRSAFNEKIRVCGGADPPTVASAGSNPGRVLELCVAGDDVQAVSAQSISGRSIPGIATLQSMAETLAPMFLNPSVFTTATNVANGWWTLATWRAAAGLNASGFTRKFPNGSGGVTTAFGLCQAGDYIGPWIWNELYAALNATGTKRCIPTFGSPHSFTSYGFEMGWPYSYDSLAATPDEKWESTFSIDSVDLPGAEANAEARWTQATITPGVTPAWAFDKFSSTGTHPVTGNYGGSLISSKARLSIACPDQVNRHFDVYLALRPTNTTTNEPDGFGDGTINNLTLVLSDWQPGANTFFHVAFAADYWVRTTLAYPDSDRSIKPAWPVTIGSQSIRRGYRNTGDNVVAVVTYDFDYHG